MSAEIPAWGERRFGRFNALGVWTLYQKEVLRFLKVVTQTIVAPVITSLLFLFIFTVALAGSRSDINGIPFAAFMAPGLIMMQIIQNSFANTASSLLVSKIQGNVVDFLMPPLSAGELTLAFAAGGATRGVVVGIVAWVAMALYLTFVIEGAGPYLTSVANIWAILFFAVGASLMLSFIGVLAGMWAEKFDHMATVSNFIIMPAAFLSGTFYSVTMLPPIWQTVSHYNPVFYLIDGFRFGFTGQHDSNLMVGVAIVIGLNLVLGVWCHALFRSGYRLKA